jgi:hypothetical protein
VIETRREISVMLTECDSFFVALTFTIHGLFKKYPDWNYSGGSLDGMCLHPVLTCSYMS